MPCSPFRVVSTMALLTLAGCESAPGEAAAAAPTATAADLQIENLKRTVETAHEKFTSLAEAMPESSLGWRPMEGVRSVSEVYVHIAADNYFVPSLMGIEAPAETGITEDVTTFRAYQERTMSHQEMVAAVDASFEFFLGGIDQTAGDLDREVTLGTPTTVGDVWIRAVTHLHEHLGQSIAYARSNEVVPPWSR